MKHLFIPEEEARCRGLLPRPALSPTGSAKGTSRRSSCILWTPSMTFTERTTNTATKVHTHTHTHTHVEPATKVHTHRHWWMLCMISGMRPPRPAYTPSPNGNLYTCDATAVNQRGHPVSSKWQSRLQDMLTPSSSRAYAMGCAIITLLLLTVLLIFYFLGEIACSFVFILFP